MGLFDSFRKSNKPVSDVSAANKLWDVFFKHVMKKEFAPALSTLANLEDLEPLNPQVFLKKGEILKRNGDNSGAVKSYFKAVDVLPKGEYGQKARAIFKIILRIDPDNTVAKKRLDSSRASKAAARATASKQGNSEVGGIDLPDTAYSESTVAAPVQNTEVQDSPMPDSDASPVSTSDTQGSDSGYSAEDEDSSSFQIERGKIQDKGPSTVDGGLDDAVLMGSSGHPVDPSEMDGVLSEDEARKAGVVSTGSDTSNATGDSTDDLDWDDDKSPSSTLASGSLDWDDESPEASGATGTLDMDADSPETASATGTLDMDADSPETASATGTLDMDADSPETAMASGTLDMDNTSDEVPTQQQSASEPEASVDEDLEPAADELKYGEPLSSPFDSADPVESVSEDTDIAPDEYLEDSEGDMELSEPEEEGGIELGSFDEEGGIELDDSVLEQNDETAQDITESDAGPIDEPVMQEEPTESLESDSSLWEAPTEINPADDIEEHVSAPIDTNELDDDVRAIGALAVAGLDLTDIEDEEPLPPIFSFLSIEDIESLPDRALHHGFQSGETVIQEGDSSDSMFIIESGKARVETSHKGKNILLGTLEQGAFFGEVAFLTGKPRTASVIAEGTLEVMEIDRELLQSTVDSNPLIFDRLLEMYKSRARDAINKLKNIH